MFQTSWPTRNTPALTRRRSAATGAALGVPLLREGNVVGVIFADKDSAAAVHRQADRAGEDLRRPGRDRDRERAAVRRGAGAHRELAQSVEELRALGEVTQAVNSTLDLQTVLDTIVAKATQLSGTEAGVIYVFDEADQRVPVARDLWNDRGDDRRDQGAPRRLLRRRPRGDAAAGAGSGGRSAAVFPGKRTDHAPGLSRPPGGSLARRRSDRGCAGGPPQGARRVLSKHGRTAADLCRPVGAGDPERTPLREIEDKSRQLADGEREQVAVRLQHEPRAAHPAQRHHRA